MAMNAPSVALRITDEFIAYEQRHLLRQWPPIVGDGRRRMGQPATARDVTARDKRGISSILLNKPPYQKRPLGYSK